MALGPRRKLREAHLREDHTHSLNQDHRLKLLQHTWQKPQSDIEDEVEEDTDRPTQDVGKSRSRKRKTTFPHTDPRMTDPDPTLGDVNSVVGPRVHWRTPPQGGGLHACAQPESPNP